MAILYLFPLLDRDELGSVMRDATKAGYRHKSQIYVQGLVVHRLS